MSLAAALYTVTALSVPGLTDTLASAPTFPIARSAPPSSIALSAGGSFAAVVPGKGEPGILVIRADGTRVTLRRPPDALLATTFGIYAEGPHGERTYPDTRIDGIALAKDGTPLATVGSPFSGAFSGMEQSVFIWNGARWREVLPSGKLSNEKFNVTLGAAESSTRLVCNNNFIGTVSSIEAAERDSNYQVNAAFLIDGHDLTPLGHGAASAMRGPFIVGYDAGMRSVMMNPGRFGNASTALEWMHGRRKALGPGIAYGVNTSGEAVGENNADLSETGSPMLWSEHRAIRLSDRLGAAYAIADDGTIVGSIAGHAFVTRGTDRARKVIRLDALVRERIWSITGAYAIAISGRILAIGRHGAGPLRLLLLDPLEHS